ncbi:hypothetical protein ES705_10552 [subsurface metagenome]
MDYIIEKIIENALTGSDAVSPDQLKQLLTQIVGEFASLFWLLFALIAFLEAINLWIFWRLEKKIEKIQK